MTHSTPTHSTRTVQGIQVPSFFYGTAWKEERTEALTRLALQSGFRAIDTANQRRHYFEAAAGSAIQSFLSEGSVQRSELFLQTKFTHLAGQDHRLPYDLNASPTMQVNQSFQSSLEHLQTTYIDSYVLHGPSLADHLSDEDWEVWRAIGSLKSEGKVRLIGISNVSLAHLRSLQQSKAAKPAFVQNRCYAKTGWDREVRAFCRANDITYQGFSLLTGNKRELGHSTVERIVKQTGKTLAQVVFRFAVQVAMIPLTGTSDPAHMREDLGCFDFELSAADISAIERL